MLRCLTIWIGLLFFVCCVNAQQRVGIAYCDLDHLYDTISSPFYDDDDYTPRGKLRWETDCNVACDSA